MQTILIIDDKIDAIDYLRPYFRNAGFKVLTAISGEDGLVLAKEATNPMHPHHPLCLIACDIRMPKMSGYDFVRAIRNDKELKDLPIVAMTEFLPLDLKQQQDAGFDGYINKPMDPLVFYEQLRSFIRVK